MPRQKVASWALIAILAVAAGAMICLADPADSVLLPKCPFHSLTGLDCPTCGSTRAVYHILHGRVAQGLAFNPLAPVLWLLAGAIVLVYTAFPDREYSRLSRYLVSAFVAVYLAWGVVRNLI